MRCRPVHGVFVIAVWLLAYGLAAAHPHSEVDQQALLSVGSDSVGLSIRIVPSYIDGAAIFGLIDVDDNGVVTDDEAMAFGSAVIATVKLELEGQMLDLVDVTTTVPEFEHVASGFGVIEIEAAASFDPGSRRQYQLTFSIAYRELAPDWLIQPFFYRELMDTTLSQAVERSDTGNRIIIVIRSQQPGSAIINPE